MRTRCGLKTVLKWKYGPHLPEVRVGGVGIVSPHGALRAYTVFLTAEPRRGSSPGVIFVIIRYGAHLPEVRVGRGDILSPHGALRAYTVFPTAEPRRGSSRVLSSSVTVFDAHLMVHLLLYQHRPHLPEVRVGSGVYPVTAWRTSCLYGVSYSRASPRLLPGVIFVSNILRVSHCMLTLSYFRLKVGDFL